MKISAVIIAKDEEKKIVKVIKSVAWCDEVLVVDSGSTDKTRQKAKKLGARVIEYREGNFSDWRNKGARVAKGDWLLYVDADEEVSKGLKVEVETKLEKPRFKAFDIPRKNIILGKWMRHMGQWPDRVLRLIKKSNLITWEGELHEQPKIRGRLGHLENYLIHWKHDNLEEMVVKTNDWSEIEAKLMFEANHPKMNIPRFCSAMAREFWQRMILGLAFLDGPKGIIYALYQVFSRFVSYAKLWEMQIKKT